ncbi:MAG: hypothetical protein K6G80_10995 [Treponema sp.]|nr:hypothetical protein [Treponema sp.]
MRLVARVSALLQDGLEESGDDDEPARDGEGLEAYLSRQIEQKISAYANDVVYGPMVESLENYHELAMRQIRLILGSYSGKVIKSDDDDDGVEGEKSEMRHKVFDGTLAGIAACKKDTLTPYCTQECVDSGIIFAAGDESAKAGIKHLLQCVFEESAEDHALQERDPNFLNDIRFCCIRKKKPQSGDGAT